MRGHSANCRLRGTNVKPDRFVRDVLRRNQLFGEAGQGGRTGTNAAHQSQPSVGGNLLVGEANSYGLEASGRTNFQTHCLVILRVE